MSLLPAHIIEELERQKRERLKDDQRPQPSIEIDLPQRGPEGLPIKPEKIIVLEF